MIEIKEFAKDISVSIDFDTDRVAFGNGRLVYHPSKLKSKQIQMEYVLQKLRIHELNVKTAIHDFKKEMKNAK
jgi:hypothetical protein|tara:strand:- start:700 stop:918 length:219 start_codon:yes stop_codon:yes gene_type:complete